MDVEEFTRLGKVMYPPGTVFIPAHLNIHPQTRCVVGKNETVYCNGIEVYLSIGNCEKNNHGYSENLYSLNTWAPIVNLKKGQPTVALEDVIEDIGDYDTYIPNPADFPVEIKQPLPKYGQYYFVREDDFWMIIKVLKESGTGTQRCEGVCITQEKEFRAEQKELCFSDKHRTYRLATSEERHWLDHCILVDKYVSKEEFKKHRKNKVVSNIPTKLEFEKGLQGNFYVQGVSNTVNNYGYVRRESNSLNNETVKKKKNILEVIPIKKRPLL